VVPAPPWWTAAATRGNSQSCGILPHLEKVVWQFGVREPAPARQHDAPFPREPQRAQHELRRALRVGAGHAAEADADRRRAGLEEVHEVRRWDATRAGGPETSSRSS
jgi:hypothetical protein